MDQASDLLVHAAPTPFEMRRLERDVEKLGAADASGALELKAYLAAARDDLDGAHTLYERALSISNNYLGTAVRSILLWGRMGEPHRVMAAYKDHRELIRTVPEAIRTVAGSLGFVGWTSTAKGLEEELVRMGLEPEQTNRTADFSGLEDKSFTEADMAEVVGFVHRFLRKHEMFAVSTRQLITRVRDEHDSLLFGFCVDSDASKIVETESELFAELAEQQFAIEEQRLLVVCLMAA